MRALLRRASGKAAPIYRLGPVVLDVAAREVTLDQEPLRLTSEELQLLEALLRHQDSVMTRQRLQDTLWERDMELGSNALEMHVASLSREGDQVCIQVRDTGEGLSEAALPHLFERFYRADVSLDREQGGAGLGLSLVQALVRAHGGDVSVASTLGAGSTFTVRLPALHPVRPLPG